MSILEVSGVKKIYTSRFGGNKVEALRDVSFEVEQGEYVDHGRIRLRQDHPAEHFGGAG